MGSKVLSVKGDILRYKMGLICFYSGSMNDKVYIILFFSVLSYVMM